MILRGDFNLIGQKIFDRMIRTVVAKFQFESLAAQSQAANLMAETDSEHGNLTDELANVLDRVVHGLGIAGSIGKKDAVGIHA